ncbi:hypothetical protein [Streptomyces sp. NPDC088733]|uniref:hypothetical protein n=1 Tax=Streptomyces sp. NPDC088733 TaxID=3365880 RepID=UPI003813123F
MRLRTLDIDAWSWLNCKPVMVDPDRPANSAAFPELASSWVPAADLRRLAAYKLLAAYDDKQAGQLAAVAFNSADLLEFLRRAGLDPDTVDITEPELVDWRDGGPGTWA